MQIVEREKSDNQNYSTDQNINENLHYDPE